MGLEHKSRLKAERANRKTLDFCRRHLLLGYTLNREQVIEEAEKMQEYRRQNRGEWSPGQGCAYPGGYPVPNNQPQKEV